ncbi:hypothetical protein PHJA_001417100 [Phtheirospermum japonicum]|uniref:HAT C-terminal dimerisation domain-containing protein n=1 Tax=Phtheirospermum japonicum TaxID=374723 RepID=A0A830C151_9LAMI|nr:hypothetical protein PHJA_001417100 [Phtheirospermum japonicum]
MASATTTLKSAFGKEEPQLDIYNAGATQGKNGKSARSFPRLEDHRDQMRAVDMIENDLLKLIESPLVAVEIRGVQLSNLWAICSSRNINTNTSNSSHRGRESSAVGGDYVLDEMTAEEVENLYNQINFGEQNQTNFKENLPNFDECEPPATVNLDEDEEEAGDMPPFQSKLREYQFSIFRLHFTRLTVNGEPRAQYNYCKSHYAFDSKNNNGYGIAHQAQQSLAQSFNDYNQSSEVNVSTSPSPSPTTSNVIPFFNDPRQALPPYIRLIEDTKRKRQRASFWSKVATIFSTLSRIAKEVLAIPVSTVSVEQLKNENKKCNWMKVKKATITIPPRGATTTTNRAGIMN